MNFQFKQTFLLLQQEGYLIKACLTAGLTALRVATVGDKGSCYTALFQLSIGFERLLKVTLIVDHMAGNSRNPPDDRKVRDFGHDLLKLVDAVSQLPDVNDQISEIVPKHSIELDFFVMLSEFARKTRYHNLDRMSGTTTTNDPLSSWHLILNRLISEDLSGRKVGTKVAQALFIADRLEGHAMVIANDLSGKSMELADSAMQGMLQYEATPHMVARLVVVMKAISDRLDNACRRVQRLDHKEGDTNASVPYMYEFFTFMNHDRKSALRKRKWN